MRKILAWLPVFIILILAGCNKYEDVLVPGAVFPFLEQTHPLPDSSRKIIEGVYTVSGENNPFGDQVVVKWTRTSLLITTGNGRYFVLNSGHLDSLVFLQGYWRYAMSDETGAASFFISREEGGTDLVTGSTGQKIIIRGAFGDGTGVPDKPLVLTYLRAFSEKVKNSQFHILAHRSGGRTSDRLPVSENSIEMISYTEKFGSTGVEIDVHMSSDGIPFLYHDPDLNIRLTQKGPLYGDITSYTYQQLHDYVRLINGEQIPTLEKALDFVIDSTDLNFVYLDMKEGNETVDKVISIQKRAIDRAAALGKPILIVLGIPTQEILDYFLSIPGHEDIPSLCELTVEDTRLADSEVWAPRWTQGTQNELVRQMHEEGRLAVAWTIDPINYIREFIEEGEFDGLLTNYPSIVAYYRYIQ